MNGPAFPYVTTPSASQTVVNGQAGVVNYNVVGDVQNVAGGGQHFGWLIKKRDETLNGDLEIYSRESGDEPRLVLDVNTFINTAPSIENQQFSVAFGETMVAFLQASDVDEDDLQFTIVQNPIGGTVELNANSGRIEFVPTPGFIGQTVFKATASDGIALSNVATVTVKVEAPAQAVSQTLTGGDDTWIDSTRPDDNFGNRGHMWLDKPGERALIQFLPSVIQAAAPSGQLTSARLRVFVQQNGGNWGAGGQLSIHRLTAPWSEAEATWNCASQTPACVSWPMASAVNPPYDLTPIDTKNVDGGTSGWIVKKVNEPGNGKLQLSSSEGGNPPRLVIEGFAAEEPDLGQPEDCGLTCGQGGCSTPDAGNGSGSQVNLISGNLYRDMQVAPNVPSGAAPVLNYNSQTPVGGPMGPGWSHSNLTYLKAETDRLIQVTPTGAEVNYVFDQQAGEYLAANGCCNGNFIRATVDGDTGVLIAEERGQIYWHYGLSDGLLQQKIDGNGRTWSYTYDANGNLPSNSDPYGRTYNYIYNEAGLLAAIVDPAGNASQFEYANGKLTRSSDARGFSETYAYDAAGNLVEVVDKAGFVWRNSYDAQGRVTEVADATGAKTTVEYFANHAIVTDRRGSATTYFFDATQNVITKTIDALGNTVQQNYDNFGNPIQRIDQAGQSWQMTYDQYHNVLSETDPLGFSQSRVFNAHSQPLSEIDKNGHATNHIYDAAGNLIASTDALGQSETMDYDLEGNMIAASNKAGETSTFQYQDGVVVARSNPLGETYTFEIDELGRTTATIDPLGERQESVYDQLGNAIEHVYQDGFAVQVTYDGLGREVGFSAQVDGSDTHASPVAAKTYDHNGNERTQTTFLGFVDVTTRDPEGNMVTAVTFAGRSQSFLHDAVGRTTQEAEGGDWRKVISYDPRGLIAQEVDAHGETYLTDHDARGMAIRTINLVQGSVTERYFDGNGNEV